MTERALFVCSAKSVPALDYGEADCDKIIATLTDAKYGGGEVFMPCEPLLDCPTSGDFLKGLSEFINASSEAEQRILYFTGHGRWESHQFAFEFSGDQFVLFSIASSMLQGQGTDRALFIIDACHSGGATAGGVKSGAVFPISTGSCVLASCKDIEVSREVEGHGSLFTDYFCEAITTGLGGKKTPKGMISVTDLLAFVEPKLEAHGQSAFTKQTPNYSINQGQGAFWIAKNISGELVDTPGGGGSGGPTHDTDPHRDPPGGATYADLDEPAVVALAETDLGMPLPGIEAARRLGLFYSNNDERPTAAAILCLGNNPHYFFPGVTSSFSAGDKKSPRITTEHLEGTLFDQFERLIELLHRHLERGSSFSRAVRLDELEIPLDVLREVVANALTHRDFSGAGRVQVHINDTHVEVMNPGHFPQGHDWEALINKPGASLTENRRVANLLRKLGAVEGIGRGFHILRAYRDERGDDALYFEQRGEIVVCFIKRWQREPDAQAPVARAFDRTAERKLAHVVQMQNHSLVRTSVMNVRVALEDIFVPPVLATRQGFRVTFEMFSERIRETAAPRAVIIGDFGMGKTTMLKKLALDLTTGAAPSGDIAADTDQPSRVVDPCVLYVALRNFNSDLPITPALAQALGTDVPTLQHAFEAHRTILLLDGFDEVVPAQRSIVGEQIMMLADAYPNLGMVLSSRPSGQPGEILPEADVYRMMPLTQEQSAELLMRLQPRGVAFGGRMVAAESELATNPLMASILGVTAGELAVVPASQRHLMSALVDFMIYRHDSAKGVFVREAALAVDQFLATLRATALMMFLEQRISLSESDAEHLVWKSLAFAMDARRESDPDLARAVLGDMLERGFFMRDGLEIVAAHRSLFEHLAIEGAAIYVRDPEMFSQLLLTVMQMHRSIGLAIQFADHWVRDRRHGAALLEILHRTSPDEPEAVSAYKEMLISQLSETFEKLRDPPDELFTLRER